MGRPARTEGIVCLLVSAILPTRGRPQMAWDALECIERQTWSDLEVIILDDSEKPSFTSLSRKLTRSVRYQRSEEQCLGTKLNTACSLANGEYIIRFDDDDWSSPERTADQINRLIESGKAVTSYRNMRFTDGERTWEVIDAPSRRGLKLQRKHVLNHELARIASGAVIVPLDVEADNGVPLREEAFSPTAKTTIEIDS